VSENFLQGKVLNQLFQLGHDKEIQIVINKIVYEEIKSRISKSLQEAKLYINLINKRGRAARLNKDHANMLNLKVDEEAMRIYGKIDAFLSFGNVIVIDYSDVSLNRIFYNYFNSKPPFGVKENKKHEFPDAFSIALLEKWAVKNNLKCYTICNDKDIRNYNSNHLKQIEEPAKYIDAKIRKKNDFRATALIEQVQNLFKDKILDEIKRNLEEHLYEDLSFSEYDGRIIEDVESVDVKDLEIDNASIVDFKWNSNLDELESTVELLVSFEFCVEIGYENHDYAYWDKEDQKSYNIVYERQSVNQTESNRLILEMEFSIEDEKPSIFDFSIEEIDPIRLKSSN